MSSHPRRGSQQSKASQLRSSSLHSSASKLFRLIVSVASDSLRSLPPWEVSARSEELRRRRIDLGRDEEPEAEQRGQLGRRDRRGGGEHAQQRRRVQAGEEGHGEEPAGAS